MSTDQMILLLIEQFLAAKAEHDDAFNDVGAESDQRCSDAMEQMDDAFLGVCVTRPTSKAGRYVQETFVSTHLADFTVGRPRFRGDVFAALEQDSPVDKPSTEEGGR